MLIPQLATAQSANALLQSALLLVDGGSPDLEPLRFGGQMPLVVLEPGPDPFIQISRTLARVRQDQPVHTLHLIAHGRPGAIRLQERWLDRAAFAAAATEISQWNLETLVLWGCEVGVDSSFASLLAELSGARVLATRQRISADPSQQPPEFGISLADLYAPESLRNWSGSLADLRVAGDVVFANGIKLTTSAKNPLFTTYLYKNAYTSPDGTEKADALVTLTGITNGAVVDFDSPNQQYDNPDYFQPIVSIYGKTFSPSASSTSAQFLFTFVQPGSVSDTTLISNANLSLSPTNPNQLLLNGSSSWYSTATLSDLTWQSYDIDGYTVAGQPSSARQFVGSSDFQPGQIKTFLSPYNPADPTNPPDQSRVEITYPTASTFRATSTIGYDVTDPPGTTGFLQQTVAVGLQPTSAFTATLGDSGWNSDFPYQAFFALDFTQGNNPPSPEIIFSKSVVGSTQVPIRGEVTYEYTLTSVSGSFAGSSIVIADDNATPTFLLDDFGFDAASTSPNQVIKPVLQTASMYNIGDINSNGNIDSGEAWKYQAKVIPPLPMQVQISSTAPKQDSGLVTWTTLENGDIRVFYRQDQAFNDNTYGTGSDSGWTKQGKTHTFNNLVGSDKAGFVVYYADGSEMARFYQDYITASGTATSTYSGYQSLGFSGGDGDWISGTTQAAFTDFDSTLEFNLNRSGGYTLNAASGGFTPYTKMIVNTPTTAAALPVGGVVDPNWDQINGYYFTIKQSALAAKGFGGAFIFDQHNSPAKVGGSNTYVPTVKEGDSTNTATFAIQSLIDQKIYTGTDQATVTVGNAPPPPPPPGQTPKFFVADDKSPDSTYTYAASGAAIGSWLLKDNYNKYPRDIAANADGSKLWVLDKNKSVNLYGKDASGKYVWQSAWKAYSLGGDPEGVTYDNFNGSNAIWAADRSGAVQWYNGGGSGVNNTKVKTDIRFSVKSTVSGAYLKGIVTDGSNSLWVVFDNKDGKNDVIQRYSISRGTVNGVADTPTGLTLVNTLTLGDKLGSVTGVTLDPTQGGSGDLWIVSAGDGKGKGSGIFALAGARGLTTNTSVMPTLVGALAAGNTQPQGIADPFVPDPLVPAAPLLGSAAGDPVIAPPSPPVAAQPSSPPPTPIGAPPVVTPPPLPLIAAPLASTEMSKGFQASPFTGQGPTTSGLSSLNLKAMNTRSMMIMMTSANYFAATSPALLL